MARRNLLAMANFDAFKRWLLRNGFQYRAGRGDYQVLQVKLKKGWSPIFRRADAKEHYTIQDDLIPVVHEFIASRKNGEKRAPVANPPVTKKPFIDKGPSLLLIPLSTYIKDRAYIAMAARRGLKFNGRFLY